jgi:uncharacterized protein YdeI (YjbR/CyaY-like superfamily)
VKIQGLSVIDPKTRASFRKWLARNGQQKESVWVTVYKKNAKPGLLSYRDVVEESLCFGWIDSLPKKNDDQSYLLRISPRKPRSVWSAINKKIIKSLVAKGLMTETGAEKIRLAKQNGSWSALNKSDKLIVAPELKRLLAKNKKAQNHFDRFSPSSKKALLEWIYSARTEKTKTERIEKVVRFATMNKKANIS